jgi:hypothetical protein
MINHKRTSVIYKPYWGLLASVLWILSAHISAEGVASAQIQSGGVIDAGTTLVVRTNENISTNASDSRFYSGVVDQDVPNRRGSVAIPRGSEVQLVVKDISGGQVALDVDSITVDGQTYGIETEDTSIEADRRDGIGANSRTGKYVGGGALIGAVIGAIVGGGKGAAIGAGAGAAAGAGTQVLTRGRRVSVPAESLLTFRLEQPLRVRPVAGLRDQGYGNNAGYRNSSSWTPAYRQGWQDGQEDLRTNAQRNPRNNPWTSFEDRRDYLAGYHDGQQRDARGRYGNPGGYNRATIEIQPNKMVAWQSPINARVYGSVDNGPARPFAEGRSGSQSASWISPGHRYVFILRDIRNGNELARDELDLRQARGRFDNGPQGLGGYNRGNNQGTIRGTIEVQSDNRVTWQAPVSARVFVSEDNRAERAFAESASGSQMAPWLTRGHLYVFILRDMNGNELARDVVDLRPAPRYSR